MNGAIRGRHRVRGDSNCKGFGMVRSDAGTLRYQGRKSYSECPQSSPKPDFCGGGACCQGHEVVVYYINYYVEVVNHYIGISDKKL